MHLFAALVPPQHVLDEIEAVIARAEEPVVATASKGGRWFGRRREAEEETAGPQLNRVRAPRMLVPIAKFGHLPVTDAAHLADALREQAKSWAAPRLRFSGGAALEWPGDQSTWVKLTGGPDDVAALNSVAQGVSLVSQGLQLFVDRRAFRPMMEIGSVNRLTTPEYLERLMAELDAFEGTPWWQTTLSLLIPAEGAQSRVAHRSFQEIPLGPAVSH
jgi:hypothetical protein